MLPRVRLATLPTPIETLSRLSAKLGGPVILCKRDDQTGFGLGGNKVRKLEYVLADAQSHGSRTLITVGSIQSNHCRQTAALAARFGMDCILVLSGTEPEIADGNLLLDELFGAEIVWTTREKRDETLQKTFEQAWNSGRRPLLVPLGASNVTGTMGYVTAFEEFLSQGMPADWMITASSSGGTQAGLVFGAKRHGWQGKILGISVDHSEGELQATVCRLVNETADRLGIPWRMDPEEILVNANYLGGGYGVLGDAEIEAIRLFAREEGLLLDPVYTARAAAGMIDLIHKGFFTRNQTVLFWHTGGTPALFAEPYQKELQIR
jgi:D-cysteine desulfhydrase family pyridoxal phosphate-dependent enzyme